MAVSYKIPKYNPETGMIGSFNTNYQDNMLAIPTRNFGAERNAALGKFKPPLGGGLTGLESLAGANTPGSSPPASNPYEDLFNSRMAPYNSAVSSGLNSRNASDDEARQRATIAYGMLPANYYTNTAKQNLEQYPWLDPATVEKVLSSTSEGVSTTARLNQQYKDAVQTVQRVLASRGVGGGMYHSGETGYEQGRAAQANKQNAFDANQSYQDYIAGVAKANADYRMQQNKDLAAQQNTVAGQLLAANQGGSIATEQPPTPRVAAAPAAATNAYTTDIYNNLRGVLGGKILGR